MTLVPLRVFNGFTMVPSTLASSADGEISLLIDQVYHCVLKIPWSYFAGDLSPQLLCSISPSTFNRKNKSLQLK